MSNRKLTILGIVTVLMIIWAVFQSRISNKPGVEQIANSYLIQGLDPSDISSIVLGTGEEIVTLKRNGNHFVVAEKDGYPAISKEINNLITSCLDIRVSELYTDNPENFKDLGVTEEDAQDMVKFLKHDSSLLTSVIIGNREKQGEGTFVRMADSNKVYVALKAPWIKDDPVNYIDQELISISSDDIESVTVSSSGGTYTLKNDKDGNSIVLENLPSGKKLNEGNAESVFTTLTNLRFEDVKKKRSVDKELTFDKQFICRLKDSTVYTVSIAQKDDNTYIKCDAEFTDKSPVIKEEGVESEEELKKKESKLIALAKAEEFQVKHSDWVYDIYEYSAKNLVEELSELLDDEDNNEKETEEDESDSLNDIDATE